MTRAQTTTLRAPDAIQVVAWISTVILIVAASGRLAAREKAPPGVRAAVQAPSGEYVGADACLTCHPEKKAQLDMHGRAENPRAPMAAQGCETCHGPGKAHVDAGGDASKVRNLPTGR